MFELMLPISAVCVSLGICFNKLISTPRSANYSSKSSTIALDALMNNRNNGVDGREYSEVLSNCNFNYTGWKRDK